MLKCASHWSVVSDVIVMRLPAVPVTVNVPAKVKIVPLTNCTVFAAPIPVTSKLLKVEAPVMTAIDVVASLTVLLPLAVKVPLLVKLPFKVMVPDVGDRTAVVPTVKRVLTV